MNKHPSQTENTWTVICFYRKNSTFFSKLQADNRLNLRRWPSFSPQLFPPCHRVSIGNFMWETAIRKRDTKRENNISPKSFSHLPRHRRIKIRFPLADSRDGQQCQAPRHLSDGHLFTLKSSRPFHTDRHSASTCRPNESTQN